MSVAAKKAGHKPTFSETFSRGGTVRETKGAPQAPSTPAGGKAPHRQGQGAAGSKVRPAQNAATDLVTQIRTARSQKKRR